MVMPASFSGEVNFLVVSCKAIYQSILPRIARANVALTSQTEFRYLCFLYARPLSSSMQIHRAEALGLRISKVLPEAPVDG